MNLFHLCCVVISVIVSILGASLYADDENRVPHHSIIVGERNLGLSAQYADSHNADGVLSDSGTNVNLNVNYAYHFNHYFSLRIGLEHYRIQSKFKENGVISDTSKSQSTTVEFGPIVSYSFVSGDKDELYATSIGLLGCYGFGKHNSSSSNFKYLKAELGQRIPLFQLARSSGNIGLFYSPTASVVKQKANETRDSYDSIVFALSFMRFELLF